MRTKTRTTTQIKPGMVIRFKNALPETGLRTFREVATVTKPTPWAERLITFTDGTSLLWGNGGEFDVARSKAQRNAVKERAGVKEPSPLDAVLALLGTYALDAVGAYPAEQPQAS